MKLTKNPRYYPLYWLILLTWGALSTLPGLIIALGLIICGKKPQRIGPMFYFRIGRNWGGCEMGGMFLRDTTSTEHVTYHEAGHSIQTLMFGPLMLPLISIPSFLRYHYRNLVKKCSPERAKKLPPYDAIWFEGMATRLGKRYFAPEAKPENKEEESTQ